MVTDKDRDPIHCKAFEEYPEAEEWAQRETSRISRDNHGATWRVLEADVDMPKPDGVVLMDETPHACEFRCGSAELGRFAGPAQVAAPCPIYLSIEGDNLVVDAYRSKLPEGFSVGLNDRLHIVVTIEKGE